MTQLTRRRVQALDQVTGGGPCLSIYLPIHLAGEQHSNAVRLRNLLRQANELIEAQGVAPVLREQLLAPVKRLLKADPFPSSKGNLALFVDPAQCHQIQVPTPLPLRVYVGSRFQLEPLIEAADQLCQYFAVVLCKDGVQLYFGGVQGLVHLPKPSLLPEFISPDDATNTQDRGRSGTHRARSPLDSGLGRYLKDVGVGLDTMLKNQPSNLLFFGDGKLTHLVAASLSSRHSVIHTAGSYENLPPNELHDLAWPKVLVLQRAIRQKLIEKLRQAPSDKTTWGIEETYNAASEGRVAYLFIRGDNEDERPSVESVALETLRHGGRITVCGSELLSEPAAALLRY